MQRKIYLNKNMQLEDFINSQYEEKISTNGYLLKTHCDGSPADINIDEGLLFGEGGLFSKLKNLFKGGAKAATDTLRTNFAEKYPKWFTEYEKVDFTNADKAKKQIDALLKAIDQMKDLDDAGKAREKVLTLSGIRATADEKKANDIVKYCDIRLKEITKKNPDAAEAADKEVQNGGNSNGDNENQDGVKPIEEQPQDVQQVAQATTKAGLGDGEMIKQITTSLATFFGIGKEKQHSKKNESLEDFINTLLSDDLIYEATAKKNPEEAKKEQGVLDELKKNHEKLIQFFSKEGTKKLQALVIMLSAWYNLLHQQGINADVAKQINAFLMDIALKEDVRLLVYGKK